MRCLVRGFARSRRTDPGLPVTCPGSYLRVQSCHSCYRCGSRAVACDLEWGFVVIRIVIERKHPLKVGGGGGVLENKPHMDGLFLLLQISGVRYDFVVNILHWTFEVYGTLR